ncbi:hypothetical protein EDB83DRAFT_1538562 [Lactarius deliciosus]|nr:hypothetical protein EDB83DRAFT_1538562 [Lactarius deliciosus]
MRSASPRMLLQVVRTISLLIVPETQVSVLWTWLLFHLLYCLQLYSAFLGYPVAPQRLRAACGYVITASRQRTFYWGLCPFRFSLFQRTIAPHKIRAPEHSDDSSDNDHGMATSSAKVLPWTLFAFDRASERHKNGHTPMTRCLVLVSAPKLFRLQLWIERLL